MGGEFGKHIAVHQDLAWASAVHGTFLPKATVVTTKDIRALKASVEWVRSAFLESLDPSEKRRVDVLHTTETGINDLIVLVITLANLNGWYQNAKVGRALTKDSAKLGSELVKTFQAMNATFSDSTQWILHLRRLATTMDMRAFPDPAPFAELAQKCHSILPTPAGKVVRGDAVARRDGKTRARKSERSSMRSRLPTKATSSTKRRL
jgi:hypothetical protein